MGREESRTLTGILAPALSSAFPASRSTGTLDLMTCLESINLKYL